jgi:hypothetical protein
MGEVAVGGIQKNGPGHTIRLYDSNIIARVAERVGLQFVAGLRFHRDQLSTRFWHSLIRSTLGYALSKSINLLYQQSAMSRGISVRHQWSFTLPLLRRLEILDL